jgi:cytochrome c oxidase subunit 2
VAAALAAAAGLGACAQHPQTTLSPSGPVAAMELGLMGESLWIMLGVFIVVAGLLVYALVRYRERPGDQSVPAQVEGSHLLELLWTAIPFILLVILAIPTFTTGFALAAQPSGSGVLDVTVVGHQWWWEFDYPSLGIVTADELHVPVGEKIALTLKSADVLHSFWVPALGGKEDTVPGRDNTLWLQADKAGLYPGQCAEFCGTGHTEMRLLVVAQNQSDFQQWVQTFQQPDSQPHGALAQQGMQVFQTNCATCHSIDGTAFTTGKVGPNLTDLGQHLTLAGASLTNDPTDLIQWINNPQSIIPDTIMPPFQGILTPDQENAVAAYLEGLQ